jgi:hypothetical protein
MTPQAFMNTRYRDFFSARDHTNSQRRGLLSNMATKLDDGAKVARHTDQETSPPPPLYEEGSVQEDNAYVYDESQKLGYTATVFVILNKMIGTGSTLNALHKPG